MFELSQTRQGGFPTLSQVGENPVEYQVQAVGSLSLADPRPPGELFCDVRFPHFAITVAVRRKRARLCEIGYFCKLLKIRLLRNLKNIEFPVTNEKNALLRLDEMILIVV
jgi:hypothetical protein